MSGNEEQRGGLRLRREGDLLWLTLERPERANALGPELVTMLTSVYSLDLRTAGIRAVILQGAGKHFSAGADLEHLEALRDAGPEENLADSLGLKDLFAALLGQEALTIALVHGACVAGGCGLATAHDFVVAAENARFMYSEVRIGFVAALVATFLPLRLRGADVRELLLNPTFVNAERALEIGLADRLVAARDLEASGRALAAEILSRASSESIARTKRLLLALPGLPLLEALEVAARANAEARATDDCRRGVTTFLDTGAPPSWRD